MDIEIEGEDPGVKPDQKEVEKSSSDDEPKLSNVSSSEGPVSSGKFKTLATPSVRRVSRELNIDISQINGTGKDGRVLKEDVIAFHKQSSSSSPAEQPAPSPSSMTPSTPEAGEVLKPLSPVQAQMFKTMTSSLQIPHFLYTDELVLDSLTKLRARFNEIRLGQNKSKMSYMPFFIKFFSVALAEFPVVNSRVVPSGPDGKPQLLWRPQHNIGIAMDTPAGLIVPNIKNVEKLSISEVADELARLQQAAQTGKFASADLKGGTISISNIGTVGGTYVAPVIVDSEVAIMGLGKAKHVPRFEKGSDTVTKSLVGNMSWSGDHRVLDGVTLARMAERFKNYVEDPELALMDIK